MRENKFSSAFTTQILSFLVESSCIDTIEVLLLSGSCDFSSDETCALLASIIDKAHKLKECDILGGKRQITVELQVAKEGATGHIKVMDKKTKQLIVQIDTDRTTRVLTIKC